MKQPTNRPRAPLFLSPELLDQAIHIGAPASAAGGAPAVTVALTTSVAQMGVARTVTTLLRVNQTTGFDCPGCAWPDPIGSRSKFEFCENGAKAIAEEATLARATPAFFAAHSVEELSRQSDYQLGKQGRITEPMYLPRGGTHYEPISWANAFTVIANEL